MYRVIINYPKSKDYDTVDFETKKEAKEFLAYMRKELAKKRNTHRNL